MDEQEQEFHFEEDNNSSQKVDQAFPVKVASHSLKCLERVMAVFINVYNLIMTILRPIGSFIHKTYVFVSSKLSKKVKNDE